VALTKKEEITEAALAAAVASVMEGCRAMAAFSDDPGRTTRLYLTPAVKAAHGYLRERMERLGMAVTIDAVGNLHGFYTAEKANAPRLLIASHIDTVPDSGGFDGVLGVILGIALIELLSGKRLPFAIEVIAFPEEEGVRFRLPFLGSRALVGTLEQDLLQRKDANGISVAEAVRNFGLDPTQVPSVKTGSGVLGYFEMHIEQGPVLESLHAPVGVVEAIVGQTRLEVNFRGCANHAGTTPMHLRQDALAGAAEWITVVENAAKRKESLVATVGRIEALPGVGNVVPGEVVCSLDIRHAEDAVRQQAVQQLIDAGEALATRRGLVFTTKTLLDQPAEPMDSALTAVLAQAVESAGYAPHKMPSGAGHDAMIVAPFMPAAMLFLRSPGGISHHPDESVLTEDVLAALRVGMNFLELLAAG